MSTLAATLPMPFAPPAGWGAYRPPAAPSPARAAAVLAAGECAGATAPLRVLGETVTVKVSAAQTGGGFALFELACPPGSGVPTHRDPEDETFLVLEGALTLAVGDAEYVVGAGGCAFVPRGTAHAYSNRGGAAVQALVLCAPGAAKEAMFAALDAWGRAGGPGGGPPDVNVVGAICAAHGVELVRADA
jgi:quercetin dioxygenase-like cupin family protein